MSHLIKKVNGINKVHVQTTSGGSWGIGDILILVSLGLLTFLFVGVGCIFRDKIKNMICKTKTTAPSIYYANDSNKKQPVDIKLNKPEKEMQSAASIVEANNQIVSAKGTTIPTAPASE